MQIHYVTSEETGEILRGVARVKNFTAIIEASKQNGSELPDHIKINENPTTKFEERDEREGFTHKVKVTYNNPTTLHFTLNNRNDVEPFVPSGTPPESAAHMAERAQAFLESHRADLLAMRDRMVKWNSLTPKERGNTPLPPHRELKRQYPEPAAAETALAGAGAYR